MTISRDFIVQPCFLNILLSIYSKTSWLILISMSLMSILGTDRVRGLLWHCPSFFKPKDYWYRTSVDFDSVGTRLRLNIDAERRGAGAGTSSTTNRKISNTNYYMVVRDSSTRPIVSVFITPEACLRLKDTIECNWPRGASGNTIKTSLLGALFLDSEPLLRQLLDVIAPAIRGLTKVC